MPLTVYQPSALQILQRKIIEHSPILDDILFLLIQSQVFLLIYLKREFVSLYSEMFSLVRSYIAVSPPLPGVINISASPRLFRFCPGNFHKILARVGAMQMAVNAFRLYIPFVCRVLVGGENERVKEKEREAKKNRLRLACGTRGQQYATVVFYGGGGSGGCSLDE